MGKEVTTINIQQQLQSECEKEKQLVIQLMRCEGELRKTKREIRENKKSRDRAERKYKSIVQSQTWKLLTPIRKVLAIGKFIQSIIQLPHYRTLVKQNENLLEDKQMLQRKLEVAQEQLEGERKRVKTLILESQQANFDDFRKVLRESKQTSEFVDDLDAFIRKRKWYDDNSRAALIYAAKLFKHERPEFTQLVYNKVLSGLKVEEIPEFIVRVAGTNDTISLKRASSFRACLNMRARNRQLGSFLPEWVLDQKLFAYKFVDELGIQRPWITEETYSYRDIPKQAGIAIKPLQGAGSRGVYLVFDSDKIQDVKRSQTLNSWDVLLDYMKEDLASGWVEDDEWIIEELVFEDREFSLPARDIKFYCFYGKIALILEIKRFPETKYCWWTPNGERIRTGKYEGDLFEGIGISEGERELAAFISSEVPAPFIRIDFLNSQEGLVFGEFTPKPGNYDEFDPLTDQLLGDYFLDAEGRLISDLLNGKKFIHFNKLEYQENDLV